MAPKQKGGGMGPYIPPEGEDKKSAEKALAPTKLAAQDKAALDALKKGGGGEVLPSRDMDAARMTMDGDKVAAQYLTDDVWLMRYGSTGLLASPTETELSSLYRIVNKLVRDQADPPVGILASLGPEPKDENKSSAAATPPTLKADDFLAGIADPQAVTASETRTKLAINAKKMNAFDTNKIHAVDNPVLTLKRRFLRVHGKFRCHFGWMYALISTPKQKHALIAIADNAEQLASYEFCLVNGRKRPTHTEFSCLMGLQRFLRNLNPRPTEVELVFGLDRAPCTEADHKCAEVIKLFANACQTGAVFQMTPFWGVFPPTATDTAILCKVQVPRVEKPATAEKLWMEGTSLSSFARQRNSTDPA